jgi:RNA polymerase sigma-70 factor (ECF subfamily)
MHTTSDTLLERLRQPSAQAAWEQFVHLYTPLLYAWTGRLGLQDADAADLIQDVFATLVRKLPEFVYDGGRSFRGWLWTIVVNKWRDGMQRGKLRPALAGADVLGEHAAPDGSAALAEREYREHVVHRALHMIQADFQPATWQACWEHVALGKTAPQVAADLGLSAAAVYSATARVMRRLREVLAGLLD